MYVELKGVNFVNKGAELMLYAILQKLNNLNNINFVMDAREGTYGDKQELGINFQKLYKYRWGFQWGRLAEIIPRKLRMRRRLAVDSEIDVVLDASGFAYSDQFKPRNTEEMADACIRWRRLGKKIILLPQAFGPFLNPQVRDAFKAIVQNANLIYARDRISYDHIIDLSGEVPHVKIAPDFTNLVKGELRDGHQKYKSQVAIVPNRRMIQKVSAAKQDKYIPFLVECIHLIMKKGLQPFFLIHDTGHDYELANNIQKHINVSLDVVRESNPLYIKGLLGNCHSVISSRFHGLISALSQAVPALATGWSHKYEMLFKDYDCEDLLLSVDDQLEKVAEKIEFITSDASRTNLINKLRASSQTQKTLAKNMWDEVIAVMHSS